MTNDECRMTNKEQGILNVEFFSAQCHPRYPLLPFGETGRGFFFQKREAAQKKNSWQPLSGIQIL